MRTAAMARPLVRWFCLGALVLLALGGSPLLGPARVAHAQQAPAVPMPQQNAAEQSGRDAQDRTAPTSTSGSTPASGESGQSPATAGGLSLPSLSLPTIDPARWTMEGFMALLQGALTGLHDWLLGPDSGVSGNVTDWPLIGQTSPDLTYGNPDVQHLQDTVRLVAEAGMGLVLVWGGLNRVARPYLGSTYHDLREFGPRLVLGLVLVHTGRWWGAVAIDLNNTLARVVGTDRPPDWLQLNGIHQVLTALVLTLVQAVMYVLLLLQQLMRLALIDVLLVVAPLAFLGWILPQTQGWARLWTGLFLGTVFCQFVQVAALTLGGFIFTGLLRLQRSGDPAAGLLLGIAMLLVTLRIPGLMRGAGGGGGSLVETVVGTIVAMKLREALRKRG